MFNLNNKNILITGASKGIGYGLAKILAKEGANIIATSRNYGALMELKSEIVQAGGCCDVFKLDVRNVGEIQSVFKQVMDQYDKLDVLINNAGMGKPIDAINVTEEDWDEMMSLNLKGTFFCCQQAAKQMLKQGFGRIVNMSSQASIVAIPKESIYCTSKGGINQLTKVLAVEWGGHGVTVNAVGPTFTYTPGTAERLDDPEFLAGVLKNIPRGRVAQIKDIAGAVIFLASDASDMVNGTLLLVDGGWTAL